MAKAPPIIPGGHEEGLRREKEAAERLERAAQVFRITPVGTDVQFTYPASTPMWVRRTVRQVLGRPLDDIARERTIEIYPVMWFVSRLIDGEEGLSYQKVEDEWDERCAGIRYMDVHEAVIGSTDPETGEPLDIYAPDGEAEDDDPKGSPPAS